MDLGAALIDLRTVILAGLAVLDLLLGTVVGLVRGPFSLSTWGHWYFSNILSIVFPYAVILSITTSGLAPIVRISGTALNVVGWLLFVPGAAALIWSLIMLLRRLFAPRA